MTPGVKPNLMASSLNSSQLEGKFFDVGADDEKGSFSVDNREVGNR